MKPGFAAFGVTLLVLFPVYLFRSAPGLGLVDSGELTTVAHALGIAHPTGYPIFTLLSHVWLSISVVSDRAMVIFSCLLGALSCAIGALIAKHLLNEVSWLGKYLREMLAASLAVAFGLTPAIWNSVQYAEVYPLSLLFTALLILMSVRLAAMSELPGPLVRCTLLVVFLWGLGLGNHLTLVWYFPVIGWIAYFGLRRAQSRIRFLIWCALALGCGLSTYLYLPIRSSVDPVLDWGDPQTVPNFIRQLGAWQYRVWMFKGGMSPFLQKFGQYLASIPGDTGWIMPIFAIVGALVSLKRKWRLGIMIALSWFVGIIYNLNYDIPDISTYFTIFYFAFWMLAAFGLIAAIRLSCSRISMKSIRIIAVSALCVMMPLSSLAAVDRSFPSHHDRFARIHLQTVLATVPENALIVQGNWDIQSPFLYETIVERNYPQVAMLDINLMQRSWYISQTQRMYPDLLAGLDNEVKAFLAAVADFENGRPYDGARIEKTFVALNNGIIRRQLNQRPVYVRDAALSGHPDIGSPFTQVPGGYFSRIKDEKSTREPVINADSILFYASMDDPRHQHLIREAARSALMQGLYALQNGDTITLQKTSSACRKLTPDEPAVKKFVSDAHTFLNSLGGVQP